MSNSLQFPKYYMLFTASMSVPGSLNLESSSLSYPHFASLVWQAPGLPERHDSSTKLFVKPVLTQKMVDRYDYLMLNEYLEPSKC